MAGSLVTVSMQDRLLNVSKNMWSDFVGYTIFVGQFEAASPLDTAR